MHSQVYTKGSGTMVALMVHNFAGSPALHAGVKGIVSSSSYSHSHSYSYNVHSAQRDGLVGIYGLHV